VDGVKEWILECIRTAGPDACPPLIAGVEWGALRAGRAPQQEGALPRAGAPNPDPAVAAVEREVLERANRLGIGPQGYGGDHHRVRASTSSRTLPHHEPAGGGDDRVPRRIVTKRLQCERHHRPRRDQDVTPPLSDADIESLKAGDRCAITGVMYTARDAAHARLLPLIDAGQPLPIDVRARSSTTPGPSPARPATWWAPIGPPTGGRMDKFTPKLLALGLRHARKARAPSP